MAVADPTGIAVKALPPLDVTGGTDRLARRLCDMIVDLGLEIEAIVVGLPRNMDGSEGPGARGARQLAERIRAYRPGVEVILWDERLTTVMAERALIAADVSRRRRRRLMDGQAAVVLLADYLRAKAGRVPDPEPDWEAQRDKE